MADEEAHIDNEERSESSSASSSSSDDNEDQGTVGAVRRYFLRK